MDLLLISTLVTLMVIGGVIGQGCNLKPSTNCSSTSPNIYTIWMDIREPKEPNESRCSAVTLGNSTYKYDSLNITKVWVTLNNKQTTCNTETMENLKSNLGLANKSVLIIEVQKEYFRIVFYTKPINGTEYKAVSLQEGQEKMLKDAGFTLYAIPNVPDKLEKMCFNGGVINTTYRGAGYKCICPKSNVFFGSRCEYKDRVLNSSIYFFNIFRDPSVMILTFSLYSNGFKKTHSIVTIKNSKFQKIVEISFDESTSQLYVEDKFSGSIPFAIDSSGWNEFFLNITTKEVTLNVQKYRLNGTFETPLSEKFQSNYLVLNNSKEFNICIKNLKSNSQLIDLNNMDGYVSCCWDRCKCKPEEDCSCSPFISDGNSICSCKYGYNKTTNCTKNTLGYSQIRASTTTSLAVNTNFKRSDLEFRTLSTNGILLTFASSPLGKIAIRIIETNLSLEVENQTIRKINYNVSNGEIHLVTLHLKKFSLEMVLDSNENYICSISKWPIDELSTIIYSGSLGPLNDPFNSSLNQHTTCFSSIRINGVTPDQFDINVQTDKNVEATCSEGPKCSGGTVKCKDNERCMDNEWQNTKCICIADFVSKDSSMCIFYKCVNNPCQNNGDCYYNNMTKNYACLCKAPYIGDNCETNATATAGLWWIAILIVLLLLLILLIILLVYCCCCRNRHKAETPSISKIHENTVIYNDQAGECDYNGPPINYALMKEALYNKGGIQKAPVINPTPDLLKKKMDLDKNNKDLVLDHPLEYGFEGYNSDGGSVSSLGSESTNSQLNTLPLDNSNSRFTYLNDLYK